MFKVIENKVVFYTSKLLQTDCKEESKFGNGEVEGEILKQLI